MAATLKIPEAYQMTFNRMLQRVPIDQREDLALQKSILLFLKLGGERLARARIKPIANPFPDDISVVKPRPLAPPLETVEAVVDGEDDDSEEKEEESSEERE